MARKKNSENYWRDMLNRQSRSGLSVREFCAKAGVSQPSFYAWRRKFRERGGNNMRSRKSRRRVEQRRRGGARPLPPMG